VTLFVYPFLELFSSNVCLPIGLPRWLAVDFDVVNDITFMLISTVLLLLLIVSLLRSSPLIGLLISIFDDGKTFVS
jgi:hypothetical protein